MKDAHRRTDKIIVAVKVRLDEIKAALPQALRDFPRKLLTEHQVLVVASILLAFFLLVNLFVSLFDWVKA